MQTFKAFIKLFEAPKRSVKIKISVNFSLCPGLGLEGSNKAKGCGETVSITGVYAEAAVRKVV